MTSLPINRSLSQSFGRAWSLTVESASGQTLRFGNVGEGGHALRCTFSVERKGAGIDGSAGGASPGQRTVVLTNLSPSSRANIQVGDRCTLQAGYFGRLGTLFIGSILRVHTERRSENVETTLELIDAESFSGGCAFVRSYAPSMTTTLSVILRDIVKAMQLTYYPETVKVQQGVAYGIQDQSYPMGYAFNGTCGQALDLLLKPQRLSWNIANGALNIFSLDGYDRQQAFVLRPDTGLINTPAEKVNNGYRLVSFQSLMNTQLTPNRLICFVPPGQVVGVGNVLNAVDELTGYYKVLHSVHRGDTHGASWDVSCEAVPYTENVQSVALEPSFNLSSVA